LADVINDDAGGERREIGRTATVSFRPRNCIEAVIRGGQKPCRGAEKRGSGWAAERESGNGWPVLIFPARRKRREEGNRRPNGCEGSLAGRSKGSTGSVDLVGMVRKRAVTAGERKVGSRRRLLSGLLADVLRSGEPQTPNGGWGERRRDRSAVLAATF
jgi:hypothetical protein